MPRFLTAKSGQPPRNNLARFVDTLPTPTSLLGLTHITSSYLLRDVVAHGEIRAISRCDVLREDVFYTFYGRASFRDKNDPATSLVCMFPSVLIIDPSNVPKPRHVFCFDSGAFMSGMMDSFLHPYMPLYDFKLASTTEAAGRLVDAFFATPNDYFRNKPREDFSVPSSNFEADCYRKIVLGVGGGRLDDRASTPEIVFSDPIKVMDSVKAVILPDPIANDPEIGGSLKSNGVNVYDYPFTSGSRPAESHLLLRSLVEAAYHDLRWL